MSAPAVTNPRPARSTALRLPLSAKDQVVTFLERATTDRPGAWVSCNRLRDRYHEMRRTYGWTYDLTPAGFAALVDVRYRREVRFGTDGWCDIDFAPRERDHPTFRQWLWRHDGRNDFLGQFCAAAARDRCFPVNAASRGEIAAHLARHHAAPAVMTALGFAWRLYHRDTQ